MTPIFFDDFVRLNYSATYQQYVAGSNRSFQRLTFDFNHQFAIYRKTTRLLVPGPATGLMTVS